MPIERICQNNACGKVFFVPPSRVARGWGKYCSQRCADYRPMAICRNPSCSKSFLPAVQNLSQGGGIYCCHACSVVMTRIPVAERFWDKVQRCSHELYCPYCCWEWRAARNKAGYGVIMSDKNGKKRAQLANRICWELMNERPVPEGLQINHHCDNPPCCSIWHLYPGTIQQNFHDMLRRNGDRRRQSFQAEDIPYIWELHRQGKTGREIAHILGRGSKDTINKILRYESWAFISHELT